jgi:hypothetical protein
MSCCRQRSPSLRENFIVRIRSASNKTTADRRSQAGTLTSFPRKRESSRACRKSEGLLQKPPSCHIEGQTRVSALPTNRISVGQTLLSGPLQQVPEMNLSRKHPYPRRRRSWIPAFGRVEKAFCVPYGESDRSARTTEISDIGRPDTPVRPSSTAQKDSNRKMASVGAHCVRPARLRAAPMHNSIDRAVIPGCVRS